MEVPVAVPLRVPSSEERRRYQDLDNGYDEEADIGVGISSAPISREFNLLGFSPPRSQIPSVIRLGTQANKKSTFADASNDGEDESDRASQYSNGGFSGAHSIRSDTGPRQVRVSYESGVPVRDGRNGRPKDLRRGRRNSHTLGFPSHLYDDEGDGDLGYSAVTGSEGARRKVIAERLEAVKSRNPVFTWC